VPNAVIKRDLQVLSVRQEARNYSVTYRQRLDDHPNSLAKSLFQRNPGKIPVESVKDNYGRTTVCAECGDKT
jgi:hypothetical protein